jgi:ubiquitin-protein ligase
LAGLSFFVRPLLIQIETHVEHKVYDFEVLIDYEYPFNRPKIFYIQENSRYAYCQDLLDTILTDNNWGPSMLLSGIFDKLNYIAVSIISNEGVD